MNVSPRWSKRKLVVRNVVDGMIVVDLLQTEPRTLHKYLGRAQADAYLAHDRSISARVTA